LHKCVLFQNSDFFYFKAMFAMHFNEFDHQVVTIIVVEGSSVATPIFVALVVLE
jgi:hypothetical protein